MLIPSRLPPRRPINRPPATHAVRQQRLRRRRRRLAALALATVN
jgi:hypothetical protein